MSAQRTVRFSDLTFRVRHWGLSTFAAGIFLGCGSDTLTLPQEGDPAFIVIVNGNGQQGRAGQRLPDSLVVLVTDGSNRPVVNQAIVFSPSGGGSVQPASVRTDGSGKAVFYWVVGQAAGPHTLEAGLASPGAEPTVVFTATVLPGPPRAIAVLDGDNQSGPAGLPLPRPLMVRVLDSYGNEVSGASVRWQTASGQLSQQAATTGQDGASSVVWTLGSAAGTHQATASVQGADGSPIAFQATATQAATPRLAMAMQPSPTAQSGQVLARQPAIRLETAQGAALARAGVSVTAAIASGGGTLSGTTTVPTNGSGVAQFTDLAITGGNGTRTLIFAAVQRTPAVSDNIVIATPGPSAAQTTAQVPNGKTFKWTRITITTKTAAGAPFSRGGYAGQIRVSVTGANTNSSLTVTDNGDGTYEASYFPIFKGSDTVAITLGGSPIKGSPFRSRVK